MTFDELLKFLKQHPNHHIMIDEWEVDEESKQLRQMRKCVNFMKNKILWIVFAKSIVKNPSYVKLMKEVDKHFKVPDLKFSFRNTQEIVEATKREIHEEENHPECPPARFPSGEEPLNLQIKLNDRKNPTEVIAVLREAETNITPEQINTSGLLIIVGYRMNDEHLKCLIQCAHKVFNYTNVYGHFAHPRYQKLSFNNIGQFISDRSGVCLTEYIATEGFEWRNVVSYCGGFDVGRGRDYHSLGNHNVYMRAIQKLVIIETIA